MGDLTNKTAVITGAGSGIGRSASIKLAESGFQVVIVDINPVEAAETMRQIQAKGGHGILVPADVTKSDDVRKYVDLAVETFGRIDFFFNNAGIVQKPNLLADIPEEEFDRVIALNLKGVFLGMKYVLKVMEKQGSGLIINTTSSAGIKSEYGESVYSASKHAVIGITKAAAIEYAKKGIRINAIAPGATVTALPKYYLQAIQETGFVPDKDEAAKLRLGRPAQPEEVAELVAFLASAGAAYMTGSVLVIDGGLTL